MALVAEVIAIGSEVLSGYTVNSNASEISAALREIGISVTRHHVVGDDPMEISDSLGDTGRRAALVIASGGLGPTCDDRTRHTIAEFFGDRLELRDAVREDLERRYGDLKVAIDDQATIPSKAIPFLNTVGTAPGLLLEKEGTLFLFVPGVPVEMRALLHDQLIPYLQERFPAEKRLATEKVNLYQTRESQVDPLLREIEKRWPSLIVGIYPSQGTLEVRVSGGEREAVGAAAEMVRLRFADCLYESPSGRIEEAVHLRMKKLGLTLSTAESCTGGAIAASLTALPGASDFFLGSIVSYSNQVKQELLGVSVSDLSEYGAVSEQVVRQMAEGIRRHTKSDYAIATSGVAGPDGGSTEKPVGTVWTALAGPEGTVARKLKLRGNREAIIRRTTTITLSDLYGSIRG